MQIIFLFCVCLFATTIGGISGVGGGVIIKPVLDATAGMPVATISFLSGCTVLAMSLTTILRSRKDPIKVQKREGIPLALGAAVGGILGKELFDMAVKAGGNTASTIQQILMILLTVGVMLYTIYRPRIKTMQVKHLLACGIIGFSLGILSSFLGIGGGPFNLAVLYYFFSMDTKTAALNSVNIILYSQIASFLNTVLRGNVPEFDVLVMVFMVVGGVAGGLLGRFISKRLTNSGVDKLFFALLIGITALSCYNLYQCLVV